MDGCFHFPLYMETLNRKMFLLTSNRNTEWKDVSASLHAWKHWTRRCFCSPQYGNTEWRDVSASAYLYMGTLNAGMFLLVLTSICAQLWSWVPKVLHACQKQKTFKQGIYGISCMSKTLNSISIYKTDLGDACFDFERMWNIQNWDSCAYNMVSSIC